MSYNVGRLCTCILAPSSPHTFIVLSFPTHTSTEERLQEQPTDGDQLGPGPRLKVKRNADGSVELLLRPVGAVLFVWDTA